MTCPTSPGEVEWHGLPRHSRCGLVTGDSCDHPDCAGLQPGTRDTTPGAEADHE